MTNEKDKVIIATAGELQDTSKAQQVTYAKFLAQMLGLNESLQVFFRNHGHNPELKRKELMQVMRKLIKGFNSHQGMYLLLNAAEIAAGTKTTLSEDLGGIPEELARAIVKECQAFMQFLTDNKLPLEVLLRADKTEPAIDRLARARDQELTSEFIAHYEDQNLFSRHLTDILVDVKKHVGKVSLLFISSSPRATNEYAMEQNPIPELGEYVHPDSMFVEDLVDPLKEGKGSKKFTRDVEKMNTGNYHVVAILTKSGPEKAVLNAAQISSINGDDVHLKHEIFPQIYGTPVYFPMF